MSAYTNALNSLVEQERLTRRAAEDEEARAKAQAAREKLAKLDARLKKLLKTIPLEVQAEGLSLETIRTMLRGAKGRGAHCGELGDELRRMGWRRVRSWTKNENGFRALWFPPS